MSEIEATSIHQMIILTKSTVCRCSYLQVILSADEPAIDRVVINILIRLDIPGWVGAEASIGADQFFQLLRSPMQNT